MCVYVCTFVRVFDWKEVEGCVLPTPLGSVPNHMTSTVPTFPYGEVGKRPEQSHFKVLDPPPTMSTYLAQCAEIKGLYPFWRLWVGCPLPLQPHGAALVGCLYQAVARSWRICTLEQFELPLSKSGALATTGLNACPRFFKSKYLGCTDVLMAMSIGIICKSAVGLQQTYLHAPYTEVALFSIVARFLFSYFGGGFITLVSLL